MTANEITVNYLGKHNGRDVYQKTGYTGQTLSHHIYFMTQKIAAGIQIKDVTLQVVVKGACNIAAYEEVCGSGTIVTIFEI